MIHDYSFIGINTCSQIVSYDAVCTYNTVLVITYAYPWWSGFFRIQINYCIIDYPTVFRARKSDPVPMVYHDHVIFNNPVFKHSIKKTDTLKCTFMRLIRFFLVNNSIAPQNNPFHYTGPHPVVTNRPRLKSVIMVCVYSITVLYKVVLVNSVVT